MESGCSQKEQKQNKPITKLVLSSIYIWKIKSYTSRLLKSLSDLAELKLSKKQNE